MIGRTPADLFRGDRSGLTRLLRWLKGIRT